MSRIPLIFGATLLAAGLSACAATPVADEPPSGIDKGEAVPGLCDSSTLAWTVGKTADESLVRRAQDEAGAKAVRVLKPGQMVTMEYSDTRLNLYVDTANKVIRYSCG
jgi:hypothetical protein